MKKLFVLGCMMLGMTAAQAQTMPNVGVSVGVGTTGISIDAAATYTPYLGARLGVDIMPQVKIGTDLDLGVEDKVASMDELTQKARDLNAAAGYTVVDLSEPIFNNQLPTKMSVEGKLSNTTFHFLIDAYPFGDASSFHITAGAYFGPSKVIKVYNKDEGFMKPVNQWNEAVNGHTVLNPTAQSIIEGQKMIGVELGDYFITPDASNTLEYNDVEASIKVGGFRPYLGIGFGRAVPKKRVGVQFDLGCQFWGSPEVVAPTYDKNSDTYSRETTLEESNAGGDAGGVIKVISKVSVYPCMTLRITGRIL